MVIQRGLFFFWVLTGLFTPCVSADLPGDVKLVDETTLIDQSGRTINVSRPFSRIISLYGAHTENLFYLGLDSEIIGVSRSDSYPEKAQEKPAFSYHDDPERFLAARPDLVLIRPMIDRGYARLTKRLEQSGITVVSIQPSTIEEMYQYWKILGILTGKKDTSHRMIQQFQLAVEKFSAYSKNVTPPQKVYFEAIHDKMKTFSNGSMADFVLKTAGGINIADDARPSRGSNIAVYGKERILSKAADIDVFLSQQGPMNRPTLDQIKNEPGFSVIRAIQNNRVYIIDEHIVSRPTMRLLHGIHQTGIRLYPEFSGTAWDTVFQEAITPIPDRIYDETTGN